MSLSTLVAADGLSKPEKSRPTPVRVSESRAEFLAADALGFWVTIGFLWKGLEERPRISG